MKKYTSKLAKVERNQQIVREHLDGKSFYEMAKTYGISADRLARIFHDATDNKYKKTLVLKEKVDTSEIK
jgi:Mor family transcriptional regulator